MNFSVTNSHKEEKRRAQSDADEVQTEEYSNNGMCMCLEWMSVAMVLFSDRDIWDKARDRYWLVWSKLWGVGWMSMTQWNPQEIGGAFCRQSKARVLTSVPKALRASLERLALRLLGVPGTKEHTYWASIGTQPTPMDITDSWLV